MKEENKIINKIHKICDSEYWLQRMLIILAYNYTTRDHKLFINFPDKEDVEIIKSQVIENITNREFTDPYYYEAFSEKEQCIFIREEILNKLSASMKNLYGIYKEENEYDEIRKNYDFIDLMNEELENNIKIYNNKSFLKNVYLNIVCNNNLMKFFTAVNLLSKPMYVDLFNCMDFDFINEEMEHFVKMIASFKKFKEEKSIITNIHKKSLDDIYCNIDFTQNEIYEFIVEAVNNLRTSTNTFIENLTKFSISLGHAMK